MMFVGRITKDAVINKLKDDREVVNFTVAINDYYKPKGREQGVTTATFVNCSYWISSKVAERLSKGSLVEIEGRPFVTAYIGLDHEAKATLNCHVNNFKVHQAAKKTEPSVTKVDDQVSDLPF